MRYIIILFLTLISIQASDVFPQKLSLNGEWQYHINHEPKAQNYYYHFENDNPKMQLPNNWYKEGVNHAGIIWFKKEINSINLPKNSKHFLEFNGVDYLCDIWVNDKLIGSHKGYFQTFDFDISDYLQDGKNSIVVKVNSPLENYPQNYSLHKTLLRGIFAHHDTRPGGAWSAKGQDRNSGGIWNSISIKSYKKHKFELVKITPTLRSNAVDLNISFNLKTFETSLFHFNKKLKVTVSPSNFKGKIFTKKIEINDDVKQQLSISLEGAKRWQTHDRGFPYLYKVTFKIANTEYSLQTGFKSLVQNKDKVHFLNGQTLYLKGTNYISTQYLSEMNEEAIRKDLILMKNAHINAVRVHSHIEAERFYKLCDEMGFLVWQDYNLQWGYSESKAFEKEALKQALEMVDLLYNHPSIYIWTMHNEPPWNSDWMKWKYPDYSATQNRKLDNNLFDAVKSYDTYHITKKLSANYEHPWYGWYSKTYDYFAKPSRAPVITEYGAQAIPNLESLKKFVPKKYLNPTSKKAKAHWDYHNFQFKQSKKYGVEYKGDIQQFINDSQKYQSDLIKFATEMLRIQKYSKTTAIFQFMFNEGWESMNWGVVDYWRVPKSGYHTLQQAFAPIIIVAKRNKNNLIEFYVINDTLTELKNLNATITVNDKQYNFSVNIGKDSIVKFAKLPVTNRLKIKLKLEKESEEVAVNQYEFTPIDDRKKLK